MAEPLRPQVPLPARMHNRSGGAGAAGSARATPVPQRHRPAAPRATLWSPRAPPVSGRPCCPLPGRTGRSGQLTAFPSLSFSTDFVFKKGCFPRGIRWRAVIHPQPSHPRRPRLAPWAAARREGPGPPLPGPASRWKICQCFYSEDFFWFSYFRVSVCNNSNTSISELNTEYFQVFILQPVFPPPVPGSSAHGTRSTLSSQGPKLRLHLCNLVCVYLYCGGLESHR